MSGEAPKKFPLTSLLIVVITFAAGAATGAGLYASFGGRHPGPRQHPGMKGPKKGLPPHFEQLELSAEQRQQFEVVMEKYHPRFEAIFKESFPKVTALREEMDAELSPLLTESQRTKFEELKKQRPDRGPGFGPPPGPPPGVPPGPPPQAP
ncbi:MAG: Spy/CpxP family protein refolding chaperone [Archangium sp.]